MTKKEGHSKIFAWKIRHFFRNLPEKIEFI